MIDIGNSIGLTDGRHHIVVSVNLPADIQQFIALLHNIVSLGEILVGLGSLGGRVCPGPLIRSSSVVLGGSICSPGALVCPLSGGIRRVSIAGCVFDGTDRGIRIKSRRGRGGVVEDVSVTGVVMNDVLCPLVVNLMYFCGKDGKLPIVSDPNAQPVTERTPHVRRIRIADIVVTNAKSAAACLYGLPEAPLEDISIVNTQIHLTEDAPSFPVMNAVQQPVTLAGLTAEHVRGLHLTDLRIVGARGETVTLHDVE